MNRPRDIDYAAAAVKRAMVEKFSEIDPETLQVMAGQQTIYVKHGEHNAEGTRDDLLADIRKAADYADLWEILASDDKIIGD